MPRAVTLNSNSAKKTKQKKQKQKQKQKQKHPETVFNYMRKRFKTWNAGCIPSFECFFFFFFFVRLFLFVCFFVCFLLFFIVIIFMSFQNLKTSGNATGVGAWRHPPQISPPPHSLPPKNNLKYVKGTINDSFGLRKIFKPFRKKEKYISITTCTIFFSKHRINLTEKQLFIRFHSVGPKEI